MSRHAWDDCDAAVTFGVRSLWKAVDGGAQARDPVPPAPIATFSTIHRPYYYNSHEFRLVQC